MYRESKNTKCCLNCADWAGPRRVVRGDAETESTSTLGKCYAGQWTSNSAGFVACAGRYCPKFRKWGGLN